ncbi:MAG: flagellar motor protein [Acidobacteria bacterium]|nr:flagellar motor protein [Acidobacteriota bacterium]
MDPATIAGVAMGFVAIFLSMIMEGGQPTALLLIPPIVIVFGGTFGAAMAGGLMKDFTTGLKQFSRAMSSKPEAPDEVVRTLVGFAERARRDGLLALEEAARQIEDPFMRKGIEMAVDGTDPEELRNILETEIDAKKKTDKIGIVLFQKMGGYAPTMGIIGTVLGLVHVLENLSEPSKLGPLISGAFVATLWGILSANVIWLPIASKLQRLSELEAHHMELLLEGIMSIQAGSNPRVIQQKLLSFLPEKDRAALGGEEAA